MKILIVEDDRFFAVQLTEFLADNGFESQVAGSVQEALGTPLETFGCVISDVMLPNDPAVSGISPEAARGGFFSGVALCRAIKKRGFTIPLILISGGLISGEAGEWAAEQSIPFIFKDEGPRSILRALQGAGILASVPAPKAFIVHGHDDVTLAELKDYLQNTLKWQEPIVLREQPSRGKTIIEKFEELASRIDCVFVLLTPDDSGVNLSTNDDRRRARQNVVFELGFFYAQMGRKTGRVIALRKGAIELPSDIQGIIWIDISNGIKAAGEDIRKEVAHIST
jgi:CheY-like chemotaxis protein